MKIVITGASGFIGKALVNELTSKEHSIIKINRNDYFFSNEEFALKIENTDAIINLAGASIGKRWTRKYKREIYTSRILTTRKIIDAISICKTKPKILINASAIGIYDDIHFHDEHSKYLSYNYLAKVIRDWEHAANRALEYGTKVYIFRLGIVISKDGGMLKKLLPLFKFGLGGKISDGKQYFSFIHITDLLKIIEQTLNNSLPFGVYNIVAPEVLTNSEFTKQLAQSLHKSAFLKIPKFILHILYGEGARILIGGQAAIPAKLIEKGYKFEYEKLEEVLKYELK